MIACLVQFLCLGIYGVRTTITSDVQFRLLKASSKIASLQLFAFWWQARAGLLRMDNIQQLLDDVIKNDILGDFVECGVWRGGASLFARAYFYAHGVSDRKVSSVNIV